MMMMMMMITYDDDDDDDDYVDDCMVLTMIICDDSNIFKFIYMYELMLLIHMIHTISAYFELELLKLHS